jgi:hypothetical protein
MKICFFLQRRWVYIGHSMAFNLKKHFPETEFCALVQTRPSLIFLENQKDITYTSLLLEEDIHKKLYAEKIDYAYIAWLEKEYGLPNLWPYLYIDRVIMNGQLVREYPHDTPLLSHEDMMRLVQVTAKEIIAFLDKEKPDALVFSVVGALGSLLLYHIAKKRGIRTIIIEMTRIKNGMSFSEDYRTFTWVKKRFDEIQEGRISSEKENAQKFLKEFRDRPAPYHPQASPTFNNQAFRSANLRFLAPQKLLWSISWHTKAFFDDFKKWGNNDYSDIFVWWSIWDKSKRKIRGLIGYSDLYTPVVEGEDFAFYPLHVDPEMATMLYAPYYTDQIQVVKATARSLPLHMKLYVKDHPAMVGYRPRSYYKELINIPNVKLIRPDVNGYDLARTAKLTITITSTGGWESILFKKPVITFGDVYYNDIPGVRHCRGYAELPYLIKTQLEGWRHDEEALLNYLSALLEGSIPVDYINLWTKAESLEEISNNEGIINFSLAFAEKLGLNKTSTPKN